MNYQHEMIPYDCAKTTDADNTNIIIPCSMYLFNNGKVINFLHVFCFMERRYNNMYEN